MGEGRYFKDSFMEVYVCIIDQKIYTASSTLRDLNDEDAKIRFLKTAAAWPTYGTTMYPIKVKK